MKIGILGGCFDPPHYGHLLVAEEARQELNLEKVYFMPAGWQWLKPRELTSAHHRWEMLRRAIADNPYFDLCRFEIDRPRPSYTVETMAYLGETYPGAELYFILGWDALAELPRWHEPQRLLELCRLVAVPRPGVEAPRGVEERLPGLKGRLIWLSQPMVDLDSTQLRLGVAQGRSLRYRVPPAVAEYIYSQGLYR